MQDSPDFRFASLKNISRTLGCEISNAHDPVRFQHTRDFAQMCIARGEQCGLLGSGQFVGCEIASAALQKSQRAIIHYKMITKEHFRLSKTFCKQTPQSAATDFRPLAGKSSDRAFWMFVRGPVNARLYAKPVAHRRDLAERHACLRHAERTGIHAKKNHTLTAVPKFFQIRLVCCPGVVERVVNVGDRGREAKFFDLDAKFVSGFDKLLARHR